MLLARLLNACHHFPGFVYAAVRLVGATSTIEVDVRARRGSKPHCSCCGSTAEQAALLRSFVEPDLVVLDDLFLARRISEASAELLQTVVHQRYKQRRSIVVTSNRVVQDWGKYLADATMATTILDRLMHRAAMLEFEGKSYRLKEAASRIALNAAESH